MALHDHDDFDVSVQFPSPLRPSAECVVERGTSPAVLVAEYRYNGLNQRITAHFDTDADGNIDGDDPVTHFAYDSRWRIVARFEDANIDPTEQFVFHHAGLASAGSGSYIDAVILRDRDTNANGTLDERVYHLQNWRSDVVALISAAGTQIEQVRYEPYGTPFGLPAGDTDSDGDFDSTDIGEITGTYDIRKDVNVDGTVDYYDVLAALDVAGGTHTMGRGRLSAVENRKGYAGYENLAELEASGTKWDVRNRVLISEIGTNFQSRIHSYARSPSGHTVGREIAWPETRSSSRQTGGEHHIIAFDGFMGAGGLYDEDQQPNFNSGTGQWNLWLDSRTTKRISFRAYKQIQIWRAVRWAEQQAKVRHDKQENGKCSIYADTFSTIGWSMGGKAALEFAHYFGERSVGVMFGVSLDPVPRGIQLVGGIFVNNMHAPAGVDWANWYQRKCHFMGRSVDGTRIDRRFGSDELPACAGATSYYSPHSWIAVAPEQMQQNWDSGPPLENGAATNGNEEAFADWLNSVNTSPDGIHIETVPCNGPGGGPAIRPDDATIKFKKKGADQKPIGPGGPPL